MAYKIFYTQQSENDLSDIYGYLITELGSPASAIRLSERIDQVLKNLAFMPEIYGFLSYPGLLEKGYRKASVGQYLMIFNIDDAHQEVHILRFFHGMQNYETLL